MKLHFIAIGGSAMHSLALALHKKKNTITGSDDAIYEPSRSALKKQGLLPQTLGWFPEKITTDLNAVILGMHAKKDNPELKKALELGLKIYSYPEFLFELSKEKTRVVIGGSHGKTTITAMILHVMQYHEKEIDYMLGAPVGGIEKTINLSDENDFILIEGDEYPASVLDLRPKFHLYQPNIALLSGISWDHINVFPTFENYVEQFQFFINSIVKGGILVYNEEDETLKSLVERTENQIRKHGYTSPTYHISNGETILETSEGDMPLEIFGRHNMSNLAGAKWICQHMGIDEDDFYEAMMEFEGARRRLEKVYENQTSMIFKDFAHSPSKVKASTQAVKEQYPSKKLIACLELHTYSSLNSEFIKQYKNTLDAADEAIIFYSPEAIAKKQMQAISAEHIQLSFNKPDLEVISETSVLSNLLRSKDLNNSVLLLMSSGTFGNLDLEEVKTFF
ncbi:UDP-N-acetylmuramate--alanine ligase/UDP-N-acetylmuramate: L-alanyl-gamma-D-glutamyl-meso-diaminopimelate ligase [Salegentibacter sp. 24]|uniref:UDP-N-acetylmuramate--L-alanine ligase n=1 Tax=Salegentibacter sp. 24 TaxID=2183986 RepID=UPI00105B4A6A|nr:Mur ligase family protein [Salegentibacter sp. 24]TDN93468.1 UDP-N-acetylmuramate--alanine ligase/UDP-N-acetylmuramate: L-alanyl-gamma-D-glutamyl-meso-diaminopimelate ligase [Salegentibacter sp. 24]